MNSYSISALGMGTVFLTLIFLAIVLTLFPLIFRKFGKKIVREQAPLPMISSVNPGSPAQVSSIGPELVAVITAAIAASSGLGAGGFRIVSVDAAQGNGASGFNTPVWGHVDRLNRSPFRA